MIIGSAIAGGVFVVMYITFVICITIYLLVLLHRFVTSHQRIASALDRIAGQQSRRSP